MFIEMQETAALADLDAHNSVSSVKTADAPLFR